MKRERILIPMRMMVTVVVAVEIAIAGALGSAKPLTNDLSRSMSAIIPITSNHKGAPSVLRRLAGGSTSIGADPSCCCSARKGLRPISPDDLKRLVETHVLRFPHQPFVSLRAATRSACRASASRGADNLSWDSKTSSTIITRSIGAIVAGPRVTLRQLGCAASVRQVVCKCVAPASSMSGPVARCP
jgi:hypothetical protein